MFTIVVLFRAIIKSEMTKSVGASMIEIGYLYSLSISLEDVSYLQKENLLVLHWSNLADSILK